MPSVYLYWVFLAFLATKRGGPSNETEETEVFCLSRYGMIKTPPFSEAINAEPVMVTSFHEYITLQRDGKEFTIN